MYLQSVKSVKHNAAKSVNRSILKKSRHIGFGVFIVHSSMVSTMRYVYMYMLMNFSEVFHAFNHPCLSCLPQNKSGIVK